MRKKGAKLRDALDRYQGRDHKLEKQKKLQKEAEKRKRERKAKNDAEIEDGDDASGEEHLEDDQDGGIKLNGHGDEASDGPEWTTEDSEVDDEDEGDSNPTIDIARLEDSDSSSESELEEAPLDDEVSDIPLSDIESLSSNEKGDIQPHQRLTINNTSALLKSLKSFALPISHLPFSEHQSITSDEPTTITDIDDDLARELAFYQQSLSAAKEARSLLKKEGVPFSRPADYFAEMVKSDEHMGRVKQKLVDQAASKRAAADAKRQRELKKVGKQVQIAKLQERDRAKRDTLDKINLLKRKRQNADSINANEDDLFDVALEDAAETAKADKAARRAQGGKSNFKRQRKDQKYGFGGKKRHAKSGDALSSADMRGFSTKRMKGQAGGGKKQRPGKSKRANRA